MTNDRSFLWRQLLQNLERAYDSLIAEKQEVRTIAIWLKDKEFRSDTRYREIPTGTIDRNVITQIVKELFLENFDVRKTYRTTGVQFSDLQPYTPKQVSLFELENIRHTNDDRLAETLNRLKGRYGKEIVHRGFVKKKGRKDGLDILFEAR